MDKLIRSFSFELQMQIVPIPELPRNPWSLVWKNVTYSIEVKKKKQKFKKTIISNMSADIQQGEMCAILGGSGAGKSTLLNAISGRLNGGILEGSILLNGQERSADSWQKVCSYVEQDDILYTNLTVYETLLFSAKLRLSSKISLAEKKKRVEQIIQQLGLEACRNTKIGDRDNRGISGGERKRVSIGVELVTNPKVLFLDGKPFP